MVLKGHLYVYGYHAKMNGSKRYVKDVILDIILCVKEDPAFMSQLMSGHKRSTATSENVYKKPLCECWYRTFKLV